MTEPGPPPTGWPSGPPGGQPDPGTQPQWGAYRHGTAPQPDLPGPAVKPGIVALGPMNLGSVLGAAFTMFRFNPKGMILLPLALFAVLGALSIPLGFAMFGSLDAMAFGSPGEIIAGMVPGMLGIVGLSMLSALAIPLIAGCVHAGVLGRRLSLGEIWVQVRGRIPATLGYTVLLGLLVGLPGVIPMLPIIGIATGDGGGLGGWIAIMALLLIIYVVYAIWFSTKAVLAAPAVVIERLGPVAAIRRSFELTAGAFWPVFGTYLLGSLIASFASQVVSYLLAIPLTVAGAVAPGNAPLMATLSMPIGFLTMAITMPFTFAVVTLIYVDRRIKTEAYEVELIEQAMPTAAAAPGSGGPAQPATWSAGTYQQSGPQQPHSYAPQHPPVQNGWHQRSPQQQGWQAQNWQQPQQQESWQQEPWQQQSQQHDPWQRPDSQSWQQQQEQHWSSPHDRSDVPPGQDDQSGRSDWNRTI